MSKIGIIADELPPSPGGVQSYAKGLITELHARGYDLKIFALKSHEGEGHGLPVPIFPLLTQRRRHDLPLLREWKKRGNIHIWHAMGAGYAWLARDFVDATVTVSVHGNDFLAPYPLCLKPDLPQRTRINRLHRLDFILGRHLSKRAISRGLGRCAGILTNSHYTKKALLECYPSTASRPVRVAGVGLGEACLQALQLPRKLTGDGRYRLLTVARLEEPRKNIECILHALKLLGDPSVSYTVVGDGRLRPSLEKLAVDLGVGGQVAFTGRLSPTELVNCYKNHDLFVMVPRLDPGSYEGFGIVYLEANVFGLPVIASAEGGCAEAVRPGHTGLTADPYDPADVASKITDIRSNPDRYAPEHCKAFAAEFTWGKVADALENLWNSEKTSA